MGRPANIPTQRQIAEALGIDPALVSRYKRLGMPVDSIREAAAWKSRNIAGRTCAPVGVTDRASMPIFMEARTRREAAEAQRAALRLGVEKGELVRLDDVMAQLATACVGFREALMQIPARVATVVASESDPDRIRELLASECVQALHFLEAAQNDLRPKKAPATTTPERAADPIAARDAPATPELFDPEPL